ncbi:hypothetical protein FQA39_LY15818 [Lamprigera yunnana]|nr:hypothetical protein FQA39_LY15818 [Lamprigera yunnana]
MSANIFLLLMVASILVADSGASPSVVIIGAGASGIAAATKLLENGFSDVLVLEAEDRIGGRIHSVIFGDAKVDLGAQWSHGEQNNTMYELIIDFDLLRPSHFSKYIYYSSHNFERSIVNELFQLCKSIFLGQKPTRETSVGEFVTERFYQNVGEGCNMKLAGEILSSFRHDVLTQRGAFSWHDLSVLNNYDRLKGTAYLNWNGMGHGMILDVMLKTYPKPNVRLPLKFTFKKKVDEIFWNGDSVTIKCSDKSRYSADHVILTSSLGVLKHNYKTLFKPPLLEDKVNAIKNLGMDAVVKVFLHFPNKWWKDHDFRTSLLCWDAVDLDRLPKDFPYGPIKDNRSWLENLYEFHTTDKNPNVLVAWFSGLFVPEIELLPDDLLQNGITFVLKKFFGDRYNVSKADGMIRHGWYSNPHFRGVYSYETVKSRLGKTNAADVLSRPLKSDSGKYTVLFGGEATSSNHYATVHGAIESGYREALRIVKMYRK